MKKLNLCILLLIPTIFFAQEELSIDFTNTERINHTDTDGLLYYDLNFYPDYPQFSTDGGGLSLYTAEDGWGAIFATNNMHKLTPTFEGLSVTGNVGIGTTTPTSKLTVKGHVNIGADGNYRLRTRHIDGKSHTSADVDHLFLNYGLDKNVYVGSFYAGSPDSDLLVTGNTGIGTSAPTEKLHVNGLIRIPLASTEDNNSPGIVAFSNDDFLYDDQYINHYGFGFHGYQDGTTSFANPANSYMSGYFGVDFFTSGQNRMRISRDGIVSIGTANRQVGYKLAVNGNIKAKEIRVETGWSDFVFESDYNLPTLKDVEQHIKEKGHLQDIPSAEDVAEHGIFLGEMDSKLLQKIEELTLYTIDQEKRIEHLESKNEKLITLVEQLLEQAREK